ncbi:hypothetical protein CXR25_09215 [Brevibacterium aurantiacum]|uniref:hypothetical protein n=1 Tax=Brevibacterium aurantiacum TaxID=273384 RepID=UPI000DF2CAE4|nr:hypothetical protein [Brevibacterium aurantiacum]AZL12966.1 hypothetical protein CXR25_09215 [Brevibacterium aurantiacum]RCS87231.1 hypothetical protein CIK63_13100 [Brevibacterium aurantiacum]
MPKPFMALAISATLLLSACSAPAVETTEKPTKTESTEQRLAPVQEKIEDWDLLTDAKIEPFNEDTDKFSGDQVEMVSKDVIKLAEKQLSLDQATSKEHVEQLVDEFASSAPGVLSDNMRKQAKKDARDRDTWSVAYVQPISSSYRIEDDSRFTYAWNAELVPVEDYMGLTVTLFTRTAYWLRTDDGERTMLSIGRWISLSTAEPTYSVSTGDYGWRTASREYNSDICPFAKGEPLVPETTTGAEELESLEKIVTPSPSSFAPVADFKLDQDAIDKAIAKCEA